MSNSWCRLWHDMPNDPKWRTIARVSGQSIGNVIAVFNHLMVSASGNAEKRGVTQCNTEDLATALDVSEEAINAILAAMEGRVLKESYLLGWEKRQPKREDNSSDRVKKHREKEELKRNVTLDADKDADKEKLLSSAKPISDFQKVYDAAVDIFPSLAPANSAVVHEWLKAGCDPELDIIPEIKRATGKNIGTWKYFTGAVMDAYATRTTPLPKGSAKVNGATSGKPFLSATMYQAIKKKSHDGVYLTPSDKEYIVAYEKQEMDKMKSMRAS